MTVAEQWKWQGEQKGRLLGEQIGEERGEQKGRQEGEQKGRQEGEQKGRQETARNLLAFGDSSDKVARVTGLDLNTVLRLQKEVESNARH